MEHGFISKDTAVELANQAWGTDLKVIPGKRIMYRGMTREGKTITLLTPQSSLQPTGHFWVDITEIQYNVMNETESAGVFFRFDFNTFALVRWDELKQYLLPEYMYYTDQEKEHWKLYIDGKTIRVNGNKNELNIELHKYVKK